MGVTLQFQGKIIEALEVYQKALEVSENNKFTKSTILSLINLAEVYVLLRDFEIAKSNILKAIRLSRIIKDSNLVSSSYTQLGDYYFGVNKIDSAKLYYNYSLKINKYKLATLSKLRLKLVTIYISENNLVKAEDMLISAIEDSKKS